MTCWASPQVTTSIHTYRRKTYSLYYTACGHRIADRKWKEIKQQPGTAGQHAWLLLSFFPFPVGHPEHEHCTGFKCYNTRHIKRVGQLDSQVIVSRHCLRRCEFRHPGRQRAKCEFEPFSLGSEMETGDIKVELF